MKWKSVCLEEIGTVRGGKRLPNGHNFSTIPTPHLYIRARDIGEGRITTDEPVFITDQTATILKNYTVQENDIVITIVGANIGDVGFVTKELDGANLTENAAKVSVSARHCNPRFLQTQLATEETKRRFQSITAGSAQGKLGLYKIKTFRVYLPPLSTQNRIANLISAYDDLIENNRRRIVLLDESARHLYREWFVRLHFPGHEHARITHGLPEGWTPRTLGDLCEEVRETVNPNEVEPDTPYIGLEHMPRRSIALVDWGTAQEVASTKHRFLEGEILFGKIRPYFHKVGIAFVDGVASSDTIVIRPFEQAHRYFVLMIVSSDSFVAVTAQTMREGSKMPRADWKQMKTHSTPLPPAGLLDTFTDTIEPIVAELKSLTFTNQSLRRARDVLLPLLMSGEIAV